MKPLKDKKLIIYRRDYIDKPNGDTVRAWAPIHPGKLWAYVRQLSGRELEIAASRDSEETMLMQVNWRDDITAEDCMVHYRGEWYVITRVDTFEGYKDDLKLYVRTAQGTEAPNENQVYPYQ